MATPSIYTAIKQMRKLSKDNIPFSFSYVKCNLSTGESGGVKNVRKGLLKVTRLIRGLSLEALFHI